MLPTGSYCSQSMDSLLQQTVSNTSSHCTLLQCPPEESKEEEEEEEEETAEEEEETAEEEEVAAEMFEELLKLRCGRHTIWRHRSAWKKRHYSSASYAMLTINILIHVENFLNTSQKNFASKQHPHNNKNNNNNKLFILLVQ
jgi:predicted acyl esterase